MIYIKNNRNVQTVRIPASGALARGGVRLTLLNTIDRKTYEVYGKRGAGYVKFVDANGKDFHDSANRQFMVSDGSDTGARLYYTVTLRLPVGIPDGEYEYTATAAQRTVSCGLICVGDFRPAVTNYDNPIEYEQYK